MVEYRNPCVTSDVIVENGESILLIKRGKDPFKDMWAFPGGHINYGEETIEECAVRELFEETNLMVNLSDLELVGVYSAPGRDPRGHYITHAYVAKKFSGKLRADDDAKDARFFSKYNLPGLAFDHRKILEDYLTKYGGMGNV